MRPLLLLLLTLLTFEARAQPQCHPLFTESALLIRWGLKPEKLESVLQADQGQLYLEASARVARLLNSAPRDFYRILGIMAPLLNRNIRAEAEANPLARIPYSNNESWWEATSLAAELLRQSAPSWYSGHWQNPSGAFKNVFTYAVSKVTPLKSLEFAAQPAPSLTGASRQQESERLRNLIHHSRFFRTLILTGLTHAFFQTSFNREPTPDTIETFVELGARAFKNNFDCDLSTLPDDTRPLAERFLQALRLKAVRGFSDVRPDVIEFALFDMAKMIISQAGLTVQETQAEPEGVYSLARKLLNALEQDQIGESTQLPYLFAEIMARFLPLNWPSPADVEADVLMGFQQQMRALSGDV